MYLLKDVSIPSNNNALKKKYEEVLKRSTDRNTHVECQGEGDTGNH
jgi:hypothetical protein